MAVEDRPAGATELRIKLRRPATVAVLGLITLGIYSIVWYFTINREMHDFGASRGDRELAESKPSHSLMAVTIGGLVVIPKLVSFARTVARLQAVERIATGRARSAIGLRFAVVGAVLLPLACPIHRFGGLFSLAGLAALVTVTFLVQARLNAAWRASGAVAGTDLPAR